jgi:hypothetical protein
LNYNDRVKITFERKVPSYLGEDTLEEQELLLSCGKTGISSEEQIGIFGKYNKSAFKLYIQGIHRGFSKIEYEGVERSVYLTKWHRNSTVVILT